MLNNFFRCHEKLHKLFLTIFPCVFVFFSVDSLALGINEKIAVHSIGYLKDENMLMLNRGLADDVEKGEHLQIYYKEKFIARAYALEVETHRSIWLVYQIFDEMPLEEKADLMAKRLPTRYVPRRVQNASEETRVDELKQELLAQAPTETPEPAPRLKLGYKESANEDFDTIPVTDTGGTVALNPGTITDDTDNFQDEGQKNFNVQLTASPIKYSTLFSSREISYGTNIQSADWKDKVLGMHYIYSSRRSKPSNFTTGAQSIASSSNYDAGVNFDVNRITRRLSFFSFATFQRQRDGIVYPVRYRYNLAPVGLKYEFYNSDQIQELSLSYTPIMEYEKNDIFTSQLVDTGGGVFVNNSVIEQKKFQRARHSFRFGFRWAPKANIFLNNTFWYRPSHDFSNKKLDLEDCRLSNDFSVGYNPNENITLGYQNVYTWDILQKRILNLPTSNMDHIFTISYNFSI